MEPTNEQRKENALNELRALGYFGFSFWGKGDIIEAYNEVNDEREEDTEDLPELEEDQIKDIIENFDYLLMAGEEPTFGDLKAEIKSLYGLL